jgi:membrane-associated phospholipid phosphatase
MSFAMWLSVPAAPPWYLRAHGCNIDLSTLPSPAALSRVDELLGINYFHMFYSRAASVFGALPSMHCAYPMLGLLTAWRVASWKTRPLHILYALTMVCAAVYLDHHWLIDAFAGYAVAFASVWLATRVTKRFEISSRVEPVPAVVGLSNVSGGQ